MSNVRIDGIWYDDPSLAPDLGSLKCIEESGPGNMIRRYRGLSEDIDKLPHYVITGSSCYFVDTGDLYFYEGSSDTWYKQ